MHSPLRRLASGQAGDMLRSEQLEEGAHGGRFLAGLLTHGHALDTEALQRLSSRAAQAAGPEEPTVRPERAS